MNTEAPHPLFASAIPVTLKGIVVKLFLTSTAVPIKLSFGEKLPNVVAQASEVLVTPFNVKEVIGAISLGVLEVNGPQYGA